MVDETPEAEIPETDGWISACDPTFLLLVERYLDGAASVDELARLNRGLAESPVNREAFVHLATMSGCLVECFSPSRSCAEFEAAMRVLPPDDFAAGPGASAASQTDLPATEQPPASPLLSFLSTTIRLVPGGEFTVGFLLIAAVVSAFAGLATLLQSREGLLQTHAGLQKLALDHHRAPAEARLTATESCKWHSAAPPLGAGVEGKLLQIGAGVAEFTLAKGVCVVVEGPAIFEVLSAARFRLDRGRLAATVPPQGIGFTVVTPTAEVIDLGTQFGVEVDGSDQTDVHVLKGAVEVKVTQVVSAVSEFDEPKPDAAVRLSAGQAVRLSKGLPTVRIAANAARFRRVLRLISRETQAKPADSSQDPPNPLDQPPVSFVEDFQSGEPGPHLALGIQGGSPTADFSRGTFAITSGEGSRVYLGTRSTNYASVDFVFEATAIMPEGTNPWSDAFFGMGNSTPEGSVSEPAAPNILAVIRIDDETANGLETRDCKFVNSNRPDSGVVISPKLSGKTVRLRMTWNAQTQAALFEFDTEHASGPFQPTYYLTADGSDNGFERWNSQLILGGGNGLQFDDIRVTVTGALAPSTAPAVKK
jgi:FecR-like protein